MKEIVVPFASFEQCPESLNYMIVLGDPPKRTVPSSEKPKRCYPMFQAAVEGRLVKILNDRHGRAFLQLIPSPEGVVESVKIGERSYRLLPTPEDAEILELEGSDFRGLTHLFIEAPAEKRFAHHMTLFVCTASESSHNPELFPESQ